MPYSRIHLIPKAITATLACLTLCLHMYRRIVRQNTLATLNVKKNRTRLSCLSRLGRISPTSGHPDTWVIRRCSRGASTTGSHPACTNTRDAEVRIAAEYYILLPSLRRHASRTASFASGWLPIRVHWSFGDAGKMTRFRGSF